MKAERIRNRTGTSGREHHLHRGVCVWGGVDMLAERHRREGIFGFGEKDMLLRNADKLNT